MKQSINSLPFTDKSATLSLCEFCALTHLPHNHTRFSETTAFLLCVHVFLPKSSVSLHLFLCSCSLGFIHSLCGTFIKHLSPFENTHNYHAFHLVTLHFSQSFLPLFLPLTCPLHLCQYPYPLLQLLSVHLHIFHFHLLKAKYPTRDHSFACSITVCKFNHIQQCAHST